MKDGLVRYILLRLLLAFAVVASILQRKYVNLFLSIVTFVLITLPDFRDGNFKIEIPGAFEISIVIFLYISLFLRNILFFVGNVTWIENALRFILAVIVVLIGFFLVYIINRSKPSTLSLRPSFIAFFSLTFALAAAVVWEVTKFLLSYFFDARLQSQFTQQIMISMTVYVFGAIFASSAGYIFMKFFGQKFLRTLLSKFAKKYPRFMSGLAGPKEYVLELVKSGESEKVEFKATIRTNIYTNEHDKRIEHSLLKTIVAFLNTKGGTVLVGVSDDGQITGLEIDNFKSHDKIKLHLVMLLRKYVSDSHNAPINFETMLINEKTVLRVQCGKSKKQVFLNYSGDEEFFIRSGPSSIKLVGSRLVDYISGRFRRK